MHMRPRHKLIFIFMLVLFLSFRVGTTAFSHVHVIEGVMVVHSHPHHHDSGHTHTSGQVLTIALLSNIVAEPSTSLEPATVTRPLLHVHVCPPVQAWMPAASGQAISLRAPSVFC